ncbi:MAG: excinuclease ABC subunit UvrA [Chitinophagales bacterium]|nr:excinuclease ABC subunit UvrA [Chitinophagales bacterium]MCZ2393953.1 excinuclease ABC subunit UvrA [Chitinophagales bacterium]
MSDIQTSLSMVHQKNILIKGARTHNLKNISLEIPRNQFVVITGVSGSGKSTLAFDTLYAEGQRRYVESLSSYVRQFLDRMEKPDVDYIKGLSPAIAIEQKVTTSTSRSTVGTLTEIYDYLRLLYARIGKTYSPISGQLVKKEEVSEVVDFICSHEVGKKYQILSPLKLSTTLIEELKSKGVNRIISEGQTIRLDLLEEDEEIQKLINSRYNFALIDRSTVKKDEESIHRMADSVQQAFEISEGYCKVDFPGESFRDFSTIFELDGMHFEQPSPQFFNFNSPYGACNTCEGYGNILGIDEELVIPNKSLSVYEGAIAPWESETMRLWKQHFIASSKQTGFRIHCPIEDLTPEENQILWNSQSNPFGIKYFFSDIESQSYKIQYRVLLSRYRGRAICPDCNGSRIRKDTQYVKINNRHIGEILSLTILELHQWFAQLSLSDYDRQIASRILIEISNRLQFMIDVGLEYLTLSRYSNTLSGGESQRINLTRTLGSNLTGSLYILDEPSIGLHPQDTYKLIKILKHLRNLGNTVIVVEHEEDIIRNSDYLIDIGPEAGRLGGEIVFQGPFKTVAKQKSLTTQYLNGELSIPIPDKRAISANYIKIIGARENNLKNIDVQIPLQALTVVTGVSGSGKSTLIKQILYPAVKNKVDFSKIKSGHHKELKFPAKLISKIEMVDQSPIGRSSRSNPVTYIKAYDAIRDLYASQSLSKMRGYQPKHFSFNVEGGRCETCLGEGETIVEMQFLADIHLTCETCKGKRFKSEILEVRYREKNISDILEMTIDEAIVFFQDKKELSNKLQPLADVGLGYIQLGQSSSTLSGGEAQRVKLASFLSKGFCSQPTLFLFDEPTTGLHFHDINKLLNAFYALIKSGHTIVVVEHNLDVIKCADYIIDLGPTGGKGGGYLLYQGSPEGMIHEEKSITGKFLKEKLK